ncbi:YvrJ family protein [Heyndrickxia camelliae]|uniref:YvrJ family protein n=1 Tax=Heyndrickxia camelliae TaxID=1707093 RepID=A0A2N3LGQ1_9BACI|nr:YvrJ family protein [Heyndrickxia camelliae]PKR83812.1 YvrJ family protein [Heyndrickxia camelliae]
MDNIMSFINEVGFPIVVTLYLLYRIETKLEAVIQSIQSLPDRLKNSD